MSGSSHDSEACHLAEPTNLTTHHTINHLVKSSRRKTFCARHGNFGKSLGPPPTCFIDRKGCVPHPEFIILHSILSKMLQSYNTIHTAHQAYPYLLFKILSHKPRKLHSHGDEATPASNKLLLLLLATSKEAALPFLAHHTYLCCHPGLQEPPSQTRPSLALSFP